MNKKLRKLIKNPSMFIRDFIYKRRNKIKSFEKIVKSSSQKLIAPRKINVFLSGEIEDSIQFLNKEFKLISGDIDFFFAQKNSYWHLILENEKYSAVPLKENPILNIEDGYSLFIHSFDNINSGFIKSSFLEIRKNRAEIIYPLFFEASNKISAPVKRRIKTSNEFLESINGIFVKNNILRKIYRGDEISWDAFDGSHLLLGALSLVDKTKVVPNKLGRYIYIKKPFGSAFRFSRDEGISENCSVYVNSLLFFVKNLKFGNEEIFFRSFLYNLINFYNFGFLKKSLAWTSESFEGLRREISTLIPTRFINEFEYLLTGRTKLLFGDEDFVCSNYQSIYLRDYDKKNNQYLFSYYTLRLDHIDDVLGSLNGGIIAYRKIVKHQYFNDAFIYELRLWVGRPNLADGSLLFKGRKIIHGSQKIDSLKNIDLLKFNSRRNYNFDYSPRFSNCWLIMDRDDQADDNAEHFYRYLMKLDGFDKKIYFSIRRESHDWSRLEEEGFNLVEYGSRDHESALNSADKIISSHAAAFVFDYFKDKRLFKKDLVFLQHGVIYNDLSTLFEPEWKKISLFLASAVGEYENFTNDETPYKFTKKEVKLTGLPRHDRLLKKNRDYQKHHSEKKSILIMPTWRPYLLGAIKNGTERELLNDFEESKYFTFWSSFLHSELLRKLANEGVSIDFFPHANVQIYLDKFNLPSHVNILTFSAIGIQDVFARSSVMVTDYSSVAFEMAYLKKPVIYYQFDQEEFYSKGVYNEGYFDTEVHGFGPVSSTEDELIADLSKISSNNFIAEDVYLDRMEKFFPYRDGRSCERVLKSILDLDNPNDPEKLNELYIRNFIKNKSYKQAYDFLKKIQDKKYYHLRKFLDWRINGNFPDDVDESPYKIFYDADISLLSFKFKEISEIDIISEDDFVNLFKDELSEIKKNLEHHIKDGKIIDKLFFNDLFYSGFMNLYFSCDWERLVIYLQRTSIFEKEGLDFREWKLLKILAQSILHDKYKYLIDYHFMSGDYRARPLDIYKSIVYSGSSINDLGIGDNPFDQSCLVFCKLVSKQ